MKLVYWLVTPPLVIVVVIFVLSNLDKVEIGFWPFSDRLEVELGVIVVVALAAGFLLGELVAWINGRHWRREARRRARRIESLEHELASARPPARTEATRPIAGLPRD